MNRRSWLPRIARQVVGGLVLIMLLCLLLPVMLVSAFESPELPNDNLAGWSQPTIEPAIHPDLQRQMLRLRPAIMSTAAQYNQPTATGMTDYEFAVVLTTVLYSEHIGWLDAKIAPLRSVHPLLQQVQSTSNQVAGTDLTIWPTNLRPSVALEILRGELPLPKGSTTISLTVHGSHIDRTALDDTPELYRAISRELSDPALALEYLAANLMRGAIRANHEGVPVTWQALATWHNQGIVSEPAIRTNQTARQYLGRTAAYLPAARQLLDPMRQYHASFRQAE
jgi:hypothetical protein